MESNRAAAAIIIVIIIIVVIALLCWWACPNCGTPAPCPDPQVDKKIVKLKGCYDDLACFTREYTIEVYLHSVCEENTKEYIRGLYNDIFKVYGAKTSSCDQSLTDLFMAKLATIKSLIEGAPVEQVKKENNALNDQIVPIMTAGVNGGCEGLRDILCKMDDALIAQTQEYIAGECCKSIKSYMCYRTAVQKLFNWMVWAMANRRCEKEC